MNKQSCNKIILLSILSIVFAFLFFPLGTLFGILANINNKKNPCKAGNVLTIIAVIANEAVFILLIILGFILIKRII